MADKLEATASVTLKTRDDTYEWYTSNIDFLESYSDIDYDGETWTNWKKEYQVSSAAEFKKMLREFLEAMSSCVMFSSFVAMQDYIDCVKSITNRIDDTSFISKEIISIEESHSDISIEVNIKSKQLLLSQLKAKKEAQHYVKKIDEAKLEIKRLEQTIRDCEAAIKSLVN